MSYEIDWQARATSLMRVISAMCHDNGGYFTVTRDGMIQADNGELEQTYDPATNRLRFSFHKKAKRAAP